MHFFVDKNNIVKSFHIEMWDSQSLGTELVKKINSYSGKRLNAFLKFVLKEELFLKLRILYMMGNDETVYFWASSACLGSESANQLVQATKAFDIKNSKYAILKLKMKEQDDKIVPVLIEDILASVYQKFNHPSKEFVIEMSSKDAKDISISFNVSRNRQHIIRNIMKGMEDRGFMQMQLKGVKFVGINKNQTLEIVEDKFINKFSRKDIEKYLALIPTITKDEKENKELDKTIERIKKLTEKKTEEPSNKNKKENKGFFSKIFKK